MALISNIKSSSSGLNQAFNNISSIEVENKSFAEGGFGKVFHCLKINSVTPNIPQVIKIFKDVKGSDVKGHSTIEKLQLKIQDKVKELKKKRKDFELEYPSLIGCSQFCFEGDFNGERVLGYSANNLKSLGYEDLQTILTTPQLLNDLQLLPLVQKFNIAYELVSGFDLLKQFWFVHADFKSDAIFINIKEAKCAIIDFDGGAVMSSPNDKPMTWGTPQDFLAPEIFKQIADGYDKKSKGNTPVQVKVDLHSDAWSVAVCIHYLIFTFHPFFFLSEITENSLKAYENSGLQFPNVNSSFSYLTKDLQKVNLVQGQYKQLFETQLPQEIKSKFILTFTKGCLNPSFRTTYSQWKSILKTTQSPPKIVSFSASTQKVTNSQPVLFSWQVEHAAQIFLNQIDVSNEIEKSLQIRKDSVIVLTVSNSHGTDRKKISVTVDKSPPVIHHFSTSKTSVSSTKHPARLTWNIDNAERVEIDNGIGDVTNLSHFDIVPRSKTTYTLTAISFFGIKSTSRIQLGVSKTPPRINSFFADKTYFDKVGDVRLFWDVENAEKIYLNNGIGDVTNQSEETFRVTQDTIFTLQAISYFGAIEEVNIPIQTSKSPPSILAFTSSHFLVEDDTPVILNWSVDKATKVEIDNQVGQVNINGRRQVSILSDTTFTLKAYSPFGVETSRRLKVQVSKIPPRIMVFRALNSMLAEGMSTVLRWHVDKAHSIFIDNGIGAVPASGEYQIIPKSDTTYTMTARSFFGYEIKSHVYLKLLRKPTLNRGKVQLRTLPKLKKPIFR